MSERIFFASGAALAAALAVFHLLFALANFGLAGEEGALLPVPVAEGALSMLAAISLGGAASFLIGRRLLVASVLALGGTIPTGDLLRLHGA